MDAEMKEYRTGINDGKERRKNELAASMRISLINSIMFQAPPCPWKTGRHDFSPFAALTGYEAAVKETARLTDDREELDEDEKTRLNAQLQKISARLQEQPEVMLTYFAPDERKTGGARQTYRGRLRKIDRNRKMLIMVDQTELPIENLLNIECE